MSAVRKKRQNAQREADTEFQILLNATSGIDFVDLAAEVQQKTKSRLVGFGLAQAREQGRKVERACFEQRVEALVAEAERRNLALLKVINERGFEQAEETLMRLNCCRIFFFACSNGWSLARQTYGRWRVDSSIRMVRLQCAGEVAQYKAALREWREARRRYLATESEQTWHWYVRGRGNRNSVAYRSRVDMSRLGGEQWFRKRRLFKYTVAELLARRDERRRARKELKAAVARITRTQNQILRELAIPLELA